MRSRFWLFPLLLLLLLAPRPASAQTVSRSLEWDHLADTLAVVQTYVTTVKLDAAAAVVTVPTCATAGANVHCATPITLTPGNHTIIVSVTAVSGLSASGTLNYVPGAGPTSPVNITIVIKISVP